MSMQGWLGQTTWEEMRTKSPPNWLVDFLAGVGDVALAMLTLGFVDGSAIRSATGIGSVDTNSGAYQTGFWTAIAASVGLGAIFATRTATSATMSNTSGWAATQRGTSVLGHFPEYLTRAEQLGASRFNVSAEIWLRMSPTERWAANKRFLDGLISRGDQVVLTTPVGRVTVGSTLEREIQYLLARGYQVVDDGWRMIPGQ
jgi:hypothetical protein